MMNNFYISQEIFEAVNLKPKDLIECYPGQYIPNSKLNYYPDPTQIGNYVTKEEFIKLPKWQSSWVHWKNRCEKILNGNYFDIIPVHYEGIFTLLCNMKCPHCARKYDRKSVDAWKSCGAFLKNVNSFRNENNTLTFKRIKYIIDNLSEIKVDNQMGIVWGGGDPTMNFDLYEGIKYANSKGVQSSIITNGVFLDPEKALNSNPTLIRISLNCADETTFNKFHGIESSWNYYNKVWNNINKLISLKSSQKTKTLFGISLIIDERNLNDFYNISNKLVKSIEKFGNGLDYIIIRPVMKYHHLKNDDVFQDKETLHSLQKLISEKNKGIDLLTKNNIPILPIKDSFEDNLDQNYYSDKSECLSYGMCGEIRFNGDIQLCSDSYGNPDYTIGNIFDDSLENILKSNKRKKVLNKINNKNCFKKNCPHNSRGHHLNRMFYQIENLRKQNRIDEARDWVELMREVTFPLGHSFFI